LNELTATQLREWEAYDRLDPVGSWREDYRLAFLSSLMVNIAIQQNGKKGTKLTDVKDFLLIWDEELQREMNEQSPEEILSIFQGIASNFKKKK